MSLTAGTSGSALFSGIRVRGFYLVKATVVTGLNSASTRRRVRIDLNATGCSAHLINRGLTFASGGRATAVFVGVGPVDSFQCTLNGDTLSDSCKFLLLVSMYTVEPSVLLQWDPFIHKGLAL